MRRLVLSLAASAALAGCAVGPDYHPPAVTLAPTFQSGPIAAETHADWWTAFGDERLDRLVALALAQNLDVEAAAARVRQARAVVGGADAALLPAATLGASAERDRQSLDTPVGVVTQELKLPRDYDLYQFGAQAGWEIDLFGGLRRQREAARAEARAAAADADAVRLAVAAETVDAYLQLRGLQARLDITARQLADERELLDLTRQRAEQGVASDRELNRIAGEAQDLDAALAPLRAAIAGQINRLDVLTGREAGLDPDQLSSPAAIPSAPDPSGDNEPARLMRRRPDVRAAELRVTAANARIGQALAEYYPHLSLSGAAGWAAFSGAALFTPGAAQTVGLAGLRWRLFDFGRVDAEVKAARGREAETLAEYRGAVLRATEEVETALSRLAESRTEIAAREQAVASLTRSRDQARAAYENGVVALIDVLDADRALLDASQRLALARTEADRASVAAVRALGGGWREKG